jgi:glycosyltransferase involved in cell wall biosynthesis
VQLPVVHDKRDVVAIGETFRRLAALRPAIFHANLTSPRACRFFVAAAIVLPRVRLVVVEQLPVPDETRFQKRWKQVVERFVAAHVAVGEASARAVERDNGFASGHVRVIYNGVPDVVTTPILPRSQIPVVGCHARLVHQKGCDLLLRAVAPLDCRVLLIGDGPERTSLETLATELGMSDRLTITGWESEPRNLLSMLDVYVLPSRHEGFPLAIVEAMLAGLPVVATDVGSIAEAVIPGLTGCLVPPGDPDALRSSIQLMLGDEDQRMSFGNRGRERALERFSSRAMADAYAVLYDEVNA